MNSISHDPRYCNSGTVFKGFDPTQAQREARQRQDALAEAHPMTWGWYLGYYHPDHDLPVWFQDGFRLMRHPAQDAWILQNRQNEAWLIEGTVKDITQNEVAQ